MDKETGSGENAGTSGGGEQGLQSQELEVDLAAGHHEKNPQRCGGLTCESGGITEKAKEEPTKQVQLSEMKPVGVQERLKAVEIEGFLGEGKNADSQPVSTLQSLPLELCEMILDHAIHHGDKEIDRPTLCSARLVHSSWEDSVTRLLRNRKQPLFQLVVDKSNSVNGSNYVNENGKLLDRFVDAMANRDYVPSFKLKLLEDFFREENVESLARCWKECASGLVELEMFYPLKGSSFSTILPRVTFPKLSMMRVVCSKTKLENLADGEKFVDKRALSNLLNSLLADTPSLTDLRVGGVKNSVPTIPKSCKILSLPSSLTRLMLTYKLDGATLEGLFLKNALPNLTFLLLLIPRTPFPDGLLFQVLDRLKHSLQTLAIYEGNFKSGPPRYTKLSLPVMKNLTLLWLSAACCELEDGLNFLEICLPNLEDLYLQHQTPRMLEKWTANSTFSTVKTLGLWAVDENFEGKDWRNYTLTLDVPKVQQIQRAFPNVSKLQLTISMEHTCGLKYIFMEMKQLTSLIVEVAGSEPDLNSDFWDSLLIGAPIEVVAGLRANPGFWGNVQLNLEQMPTINNLQNLKKLSLVEAHNAPAVYKADASLPPLISDLAFHFSLLKMTQLRTLDLKHRFVASEGIAEKWRSLGRTLVYSTWETE